MMKKLPIGISDFDTLIRENYYFADKSLLIKDLFERESAKVVLIPRPRRFGKTLNMSMMNAFFNLKNKEKKYAVELTNPVKIGMSFYGKEFEIQVLAPVLSSSP